MRPIHHARSASKTSNDADSCPTLRLGVRAISLAAPLDAQAGTQVQTGLSLCLQPHLGAAVHGDVMEGLTRAERRPGQAGYPLHNGLDARLTTTTALTPPAQFIAVTRGRKVDCLASYTDQTCCSINSILRGCAER